MIAINSLRVAWYRSSITPAYASGDSRETHTPKSEQLPAERVVELAPVIRVMDQAPKSLRTPSRTSVRRGNQSKQPCAFDAQGACQNRPCRSTAKAARSK